jgi:hypothetical protein
MKGKKARQREPAGFDFASNQTHPGEKPAKKART